MYFAECNTIGTKQRVTNPQHIKTNTRCQSGILVVALTDAAHNGANAHLKHVVTATCAPAAFVWMEPLRAYNNVLRASAGAIAVARVRTTVFQI